VRRPEEPPSERSPRGADPPVGVGVGVTTGAGELGGGEGCEGAAAPTGAVGGGVAEVALWVGVDGAG
jgi:hypothetical protein